MNKTSLLPYLIGLLSFMPFSTNAQSDCNIAAFSVTRPTVDRMTRQEIGAVLEQLNKTRALCPEKAKEVDAKVEEFLGYVNGRRDRSYIYKGKFTLAYKNGQYGFIDQKGKVLIPYQFRAAMPFDYIGYAKVSKREGQYLMDTTGQTYKVAYQLEDLNKTVLALDLRGVPLDAFPSVILNHPQLLILLLDGSYNNNQHFKRLPRRIKKLKQLKTLSLSYCRLEKLPVSIGNLSNLQWLNIGNNQISTLPVSIGNLANLHSLYTGRNQIHTLPLTMGNLSNLQELYIGANQLAELPGIIGELSHLKILHLQSNQLASLPTEIGNLANLQELDIWDNQLRELPLSIGDLSNLQWLNLWQNQLQELPTTIGNLSSLQWLNVEKNQLVILPTEIGQLSNLQRLYLGENPLKELPMSVGNLTNLESLGIRSTPLKVVPVEIGVKLTKLRGID